MPARGGSARIPHKNLALLGGHPLLAHTIAAARSARLLDGVYVSTDDAEIADVARAYGAEVIERPAALATAEASTEPVLLHAVEQIESRSGSRVALVVLLQPTSPCREARRIDEAIALQRTTGCDSVVGVTPNIEYYYLGDVDGEGRLTPGFDPKHRLRSQEIQPRYRENGAIYVTTRTLLFAERCRMGGDIRALVMPDEESIDVDTATDLAHCEVVIARREATGLLDPLRWAAR